MVYFLIGLIVLLLLLLMLQIFSDTPPATVVQILLLSVAFGLLLIASFLALRGLWGISIPLLLTALPFFQRVLQQRLRRRQGESRQNRHEQNARDDPRDNTQAGSPMREKEAYALLGLPETASAEQIKAAYHRLIKRCHPDSGGSPFLAAQLNQARDLLLRKHR